MTLQFTTLEEMIVATAEAVRPAERLTVSQAAGRFHEVNLPGTHVGKYSYDKTPYAREWDDELNSLDYTEQVRIGPARCSKSAGFINWLIYTAVCDPANMMAVHMTQSTARDWSKEDLGRAQRHSEELRKRLRPGRQNDNTHDKDFLSGMRLRINWPSISELSGKTSPRNWLFDYDRMPLDIDKEGSPFALTVKRAGTFKRFGMTVADSSPGHPVQNAKWIATSPHEAPPCEGILALYNHSDRRRWQWRCPQCQEAFEPDFKLMSWPASADFMESAEQAVLVCPHDGFPMTPEMKYELNLGGRWVKEGQVWLPDGSMTGTPRRSNRAGFWLKGPAAGFMDWKDLVYKWLVANDDYDRTGSEEALKTTVNTDQGLPYTYKVMESGLLPESLKDRAEDWGGSMDDPVVPEGVRFIIAQADVQKSAFVLQFHGITAAGDICLLAIDKIRKSNREDERGDLLQVDPAAHPEDWDLLIEHMILRSFPLADGSGRRMAVKLSACDSGGRAGVTTNAYNFWRRLRDDSEGRSLHNRFHLLKGEPSKTAPRLRQNFPDSGRKDRHSGARGDVPVWFINPNVVKDQAANLLGRDEAAETGFGLARVRFPVWLPDFIYTQLTAEVRDPAKGWINPSGRRNEAFDLLYYCVAFTLHPSIRLEHIDWANPPGWAEGWDSNDLVTAEDGVGLVFVKPVARGLEDLAGDLA